MAHRRGESMAQPITRRSFITASGAALATALVAGCSTAQEKPDTTSKTSDDSTTKQGGIDYMVLVNKQNKLPDGWEDALDIVSLKNSEDWDVEAEAKAYDAYLGLKEDLESDGVYVDLDSGYRSVAEQQRIVDDFTEKYGEEYVKLYVAVPGYSEHHTGLALDLFLIIDGKGVYENEDMVTYPEIWEKIHAKLADHGFILRFLPKRKIITGYSYEPWHIRYVDSPDIAHQIMDADITLEEYLDAVDPIVAGCTVDYGTSELYTEADMDSALDAILKEFSTWTGCTLQRFAFSGDAACGPDEVDYVNSLRKADDPDSEAFDQAIVFTTEFHTPSEKEAEGTAWEPDTDITGWTWHLGRTGNDGAWKLLTWGYE